MIHAADNVVEVICSKLDDLKNYTQPNASGMMTFLHNLLSNLFWEKE